MRRKIAIFDVLGVRPEDDLATIRKAWRNKVKEHHPDVADDKDAAARTLVRVNAAFSDLKTHTPFVERRRKIRRRARRGRERAWTAAERAAAARKRAADDLARAVEAARRKADAEARARRLAKEALQRRAAERAAALAERSKIRSKLAEAEEAMLLTARDGYDAARRVVAKTAPPAALLRRSH